ncbi:MAG TPA: hypothetical protein VGM67_20725 [Gemmatimonadaceae bacterium]
MHNSSTPALRRSATLRRSVTAFAVAAAALAASTSACSDSLPSLGPTPALAESNASQLFDAFRARFNQPQFSPGYEAARKKLAKSALVPSGIFDDDATWSAKPSAALRELYAGGTTVDGHYFIEMRPSLTVPAHPGDSRHFVSLERLAPSVYRWDTRVDMSVGDVSAADVSGLVSALLAAPEGRTDREVRDNYRAAVPRAMAAFGRGLAIDSLHVVPSAGGFTSVVVTIGFHPELMRPTYPALTSYVDKYLGPAKYHLAFADRAGTELFDVVGRDRQATLRYRLQGGKLTSLFGPPRAWPDTVQLTADLSLKVKLFTVGFHSLLTDFVITNAGHDRGWAVVAQHEPKWDLPFVAERLIRTPLRRPFEDGGAVFRVSVRDSVGEQSIFSRRTRLDVQESTIMRFLGGLGSHALGDIDASVVSDEARYWRDGFTALEADMRAVPHRGER